MRAARRSSRPFTRKKHLMRSELELLSISVRVITLDDCPELDSRKYPFSKTLKLSDETRMKLEKIEAAGKCPSGTLRMIIEEALKAI